MTVKTQVYKIEPITGNGVARTYSFSPMTIDSADELEVVTTVIATGVETVLTRGTGPTNYAVLLTSFPGTGSINFPTAGGTLLPSTETITIRRVLTLEQATDLQNQGDYDAEVQEAQFDKLLKIDLQQQEQLDRSLRIQVSELSTVDAALPFLVASRYPRVKSDGTGFELVDSVSVTGALSNVAPEAVVLVDPSAGVSTDIARADHTHRAAPQDRTSINMFNAANFI